MLMGIKNRIFYLLAIVLMVAAGCSKQTYNGEELLIEWHDPASKITFRVTERPGVMVHTFTKLYVERDGRVDSNQIDDDARFGTISLVRYENWLLVLSDNEVWAGFDYNISRILGEHANVMRCRDGAAEITIGPERDERFSQVDSLKRRLNVNARPRLSLCL